jgi:hypothetical protein
VIELVAVALTFHVPSFDKSIWNLFENVAEELPVPPFVMFPLKVTFCPPVKLPEFTLGTPPVKSIVPDATLTVAELVADVPPGPAHATE